VSPSTSNLGNFLHRAVSKKRICIPVLRSSDHQCCQLQLVQTLIDAMHFSGTMLESISACMFLKLFSSSSHLLSTISSIRPALNLISLYLHLTNADTLPWPHHHQPIELRSREKGRVGEAERREDGEGGRGVRSSDSPGIRSN